MTRVYLVRHGFHDLVGKVLAGRMPGVHLGTEGRAQAQRLAAWFADQNVTAVWSSPLERCRDTASVIADRLALPVKTDEDLNELDCGEWTGKTFDALANDPRWLEWNAERAKARIPGGETAAAVQGRIGRMLDRVVGTDREAAILVSHSDVIKIAVLTLLGAPLGRHDGLDVDPGSVTTLDLWPGGGKVVRLNEGAA